MDLRKVKEEMQFITGVISQDTDYLLYLLLKSKPKTENDVIVKPSTDEGYFKEESLEDWFNNL